MSLNTNRLFSTVSSAQAETWKPVKSSSGSGKSSVATAFSAPSVQEADSVDVSPLGKALTGVAAKVFEKLDGKARGMLENYVKAGIMTAEEVVGGLRAIGKEAVQSRYMNKLSEENDGPAASARDVREDLYNKQMKFMDGAADLMKTLEKSGAEDSSEAASKEKENLQSLTRYEQEFIEENGNFEEIDYSQSQSYIAISARDLKASSLFSDEGDGQFFSKSDTASLSKLIDLGFDTLVYTSAAKAAVSEIDLSGVQRTSSTNAATTAANAVPSINAKQASSQAEVGSAALAASTMKTPENDAMLALLKANAEKTPDRQRMPSVQPRPIEAGTDGNDAVLAAMTQALKTDDMPAGSRRTNTIV